MIREVFDLLDKDRDGTISLSELRVALHTLDNALPKGEIKELVASIDENGDGEIDFDELRQLMGCTQGMHPVSSLTTISAADNRSGSPQCSLAMRQKVQAAVEHPYFTRAVVFCITVNTVSLAAEHHGQSDDLTLTIEITNAIFAFVFLVEVCLRVVSVGAKEYFYDGFNVCDAIIVALGIVEVFVNSGGISVLRSFRLLRMFKLARCALRAGTRGGEAGRAGGGVALH